MPPPPNRVSDAEPRYSPDGAWFWTGVGWIPAHRVFERAEARPAAAAPPPADTVRPAWTGAAVIALIAVLVVCAATTGVWGDALTLRALQAAWVLHQAPSADSIFEMPFSRHIGSAELRGSVTAGGQTDTETGAIDLSPVLAMHTTARVGGAYAGQYLDFGGVCYAVVGEGQWDVQTPVDGIDHDLGWDGGPPPPQLRVAGREVVAGQPAWHLESPSGGNWWIGVATGDPLRFQFRSAIVEMSFTFDRFGDARAIMAPPSSVASTTVVSGPAGTRIAGPGLSITALQTRVVPHPATPPPAGYRYQAVLLSYTNEQPDAIDFENEFTLTGADGSQYPQTGLVDLTPALPPGVVAGGATVRGWDVFVVRNGARSLTLRGGSQSLTQSLDLLISIPLR